MIERWYPVAIALIGGIAAFLRASPGLLHSENALMFIGGLGAIAIGFTGTGLTILIAIEDRPLISWLRRAPGDCYDLLLRYMLAVLHWWFVALLLASAAFITDLTKLPSGLPMVAVAGLIAFSLGGMAAWYRVGRLTVSLLRSSIALSQRRLHPEDDPMGCRQPTPREAAQQQPEPGLPFQQRERFSSDV